MVLLLILIWVWSVSRICGLRGSPSERSHITSSLIFARPLVSATAASAYYVRRSKRRLDDQTLAAGRHTTELATWKICPSPPHTTPSTTVTPLDRCFTRLGNYSANPKCDSSYATCAEREFLATLTQVVPFLLGGEVCLWGFVVRRSLFCWVWVGGRLLRILSSGFSCLRVATSILPEPLQPTSSPLSIVYSSHKNVICTKKATATKYFPNSTPYSPSSSSRFPLSISHAYQHAPPKPYYP